MGQCLFCRMECPERPDFGATNYRCPRCGEYRAGMYEWMVQGLNDRFPYGRFAASHAVRRMQVQGRQPPLIQTQDFERLWSAPLPNPQRQLDLLILAVGDAGLPPQDYLRDRIERFCAEVGTSDDPVSSQTKGLKFIWRELEKRNLLEIEPHPPAPDFGIRLTINGWSRYEQLRREVIESRTAFMAMGYGNPTVSEMVEKHFVPAVGQAGFELLRLDDRPRPGIIDNRMRVDIRTAKFLVCDLTDENRGAYWEGGFAEGLGKEVFYTCERAKFEEKKTHFDTEHSHTVRWLADDPAGAVAELKAAIRNAFPSDAIMQDQPVA